MKMTNKYGLPAPMVEAIMNRPYDSEGSYITATSLLQPPLIRQLRKLHADEIEEDVIDRVWSFIGDIGHGILERSAEHTEGESERRIFLDIEGYKCSGKFDYRSVTDNVLTDYKFTSAWSVVFGEEEWHEQLNILDYLLFTDGIELESLQICAILRDWNKREAERNADYPQKQVVIVPIERWSREDQEIFIARRLAMHVGADEGIIPACSEHERWYTGTKWAVIKKGQKRAQRVLDSLEEAEAWKEKAEDSKKMEIVVRPGENRRCENFCDVAQWCPVFAQLKAEKEALGAEE